MAFFEDFGKKFAKTSQSVAKKAKDVAEVGNLKLQIKEEERRIKGEFAELGQQYYALHCEDAPEELQELVNRVTEVKKRISMLEEQIHRIEHERSCPECGTRMPEDGQYCISCGKRYPEDKAEELEAAVVEYKTCQECGAHILTDAVFCTKCGTKQEEQGPKVPSEEEIVDTVEEPEVWQEDRTDPPDAGETESVPGTVEESTKEK